MKVNFFILEEASKMQAFVFACQIIEKKFTEQKNVYVHTSSIDEAKKLDALLWTFREDSFVPHQLTAENKEISAPIEIGYAKPSVHLSHFMINLSHELPEFYQQFDEIIEIIFSEPTIQQLARHRYRQYRDLGCELTTQKIKVNLP